MRIDLARSTYGNEGYNETTEYMLRAKSMRHHSYSPRDEFLYRVCPHCGTEFHIKVTFPGLYRCSYNRIESQRLEREIEKEREFFSDWRNAAGRIRNSVEFMDACLVCGGTQPTENSKAFYRLTPDNWDGPDEVFREMREMRIESYRSDAEIRLQKTLDSLSLTDQPEIQSEQGSLIRTNRNLLCDYIGHILKVESAIYATEKRLQELYFMDTVASIDSLSQNGKLLFKAKQELEKAMSTYSALQKEDVSSLVKRGALKIGPKPVEPSSPAPFSMREPQEPLYATPGFLNKKKILAKNEELKLAYQKELLAFEDAKAAHEKEMQVYQDQMAQYNAEYFQYAAKRSEENARVEREYQANLAKERECHSQKINEATRLVEQKRRNLDEIRSTPPHTASLKVIREEIATAEKTLSDLMMCRSRLYAQNVVYPKYRNIVAIASFNDYLMSGRCETLEGSTGAYDKYEFECRADMIISKLTDVLSSLEEIKNNQYMLYHQISEVNNGLSKLNSAMERALDALDTISSNTKALTDISVHTEKIAKNSEVIAYNTAATAFYAKKNAELTNALGFMVALK